MFNVDADQLDRNLVFVAASIVKMLGVIFLNIWGGGPAWTAPPGEKIEHDDLAFLVRKEDVFAAAVSFEGEIFGHIADLGFSGRLAKRNKKQRN